MEFGVTLVQMPTKEGDRKYNFGLARHLLKNLTKRDGTNLIILPELFAIGFRHDDYRSQGPGIPGPTSDFLLQLAQEKEAFVIATGIEKSPERFYNTLLVAKPDGKVQGSYRKIHPFQEERDIFDGGDTIVLFDCEGLKVGVQTCYDIRFPELSRRLALEGAELLVVPAAFPDPRSAHWNALVHARAIENQVYVAATNRIGFGFDGKTYFGHSQLIDPWGVILTRRNSEAQIIHNTGNTEMVKAVRKQITCYADRAPAGYENVKWY